ncbi:hypothetical protein ACFWOX_33920 [Streptomyces sp. NPDC058467]|uniref:hypothetical protein n=1 Tax=Streptomyces sp. NPDC058467 TaxID=3346513 RepID=UPI00365EDB08
MSTDKVVIIIAVSIVGAVFCALQVRRALREPLERDLIVTAARRRAALLNEVKHDVGPDALRLLQDLDAHLDEYFARMSHLFEELGPPTPDLTGLERLRQAVRDEQQKGGEVA